MNELTAYSIQHCGLRWLKLDVDMPVGEMLAEAMDEYYRFIPHRSAEDHVGWKSLVVHGLDRHRPGAPENYGYTDWNAPYEWTGLCPTTAEWVRTAIPMKRFFRVRIMLLEPGGHIGLHRDTDQAGLYPINIALSQPDRCFLMIDDDEVPFEPGSAFMLDISRPHWAINDSIGPRYHMIVHGVQRGALWEEFVVRSFRKRIDPKASRA